ncbi:MULTISPECIES: hypothetical protein [Bacillus]|uniref:hypothetical protein n=1 Tax=Bacillus TaxID=1386 RepID=UPI000BB701B0|nr:MULTISPECIES: hypothetical protein [Bacillus]
MLNKNSFIHKILYLSLFSLIIISLAGCSITEQEAVDASIQIVESSLAEETKEANTETENISYYLPSAFTIESEVNNNIVIENNDQTYILFVNPLESVSSVVVYETTLGFYEDPIVNKQLNNEEHFIFFIVDNGPSEQTYEVIVGIGGMKMTTITSAANMKQSVQDMIDIINSVNIKQ